MTTEIKTKKPLQIEWILTACLFSFLVVAVLVPSMLPGALANNIWSLQVIQRVFAEDETEGAIPAPPPYHPHASIWISRQDLAQSGTHRLDPIVDPVTPQNEEDTSLDRWVSGMNNYSDIQTLDVKARYLYQQGSYAEAFEIWKTIGQKAALAEAASQASAYGINSLALQAYRAAYEIDPEGYAQPYARALQNNGQSERAIEVLNAAIQAYPLSRSADSWQVLIGDIYRAGSDWAQAENIYQKVLDENPGAEGAWIGMGWLIYQRDQDVVEAVAQFDRAIAVDPQSGAGQAAMGRLFSQRKQYDIAAEWYRVAYERNRQSQSYGLSYANALYDEGRTEQAIAEYQNLVTRFPDFASAYYQIAWVYHQEGQSDQAVTAIETALAVNPMPNIAYYTRADRIYQSNQQTQKSQDLFQAGEKAFQETIDFFPNFPESYLQIAKFYETFAQIDRALEAYQTALTIEPGNLSAQQALERLTGDA